MKQIRRHAGYTLIEVVIAIAISILLCKGVYHFLASQRVHSQHVIALANMTENAYATRMILQQAIQKAGFSGCIAWHDRFSHPIEPLKQVAPSGIQNPKPGSKDPVLQLQFWENIPDTIVQQITPLQITLTSHYPFKAGQSIILHSCSHWETVMIEKIRNHGSTVILMTQKPIHMMTNKNPQIARSVIAEWTIAPTTRINETQKTIYALFYRENGQAWQEVISDVYAIDYTLGQSIQIEFIIGSENEIAHAKKPLVLTHNVFQPTDKRLYKKWQFMIERFH